MIIYALLQQAVMLDVAAADTKAAPIPLISAILTHHRRDTYMCPAGPAHNTAVSGTTCKLHTAATCMPHI
jgi:hypothetical protein